MRTELRAFLCRTISCNINISQMQAPRQLHPQSSSQSDTMMNVSLWPLKFLSQLSGQFALLTKILSMKTRVWRCLSHTMASRVRAAVRIAALTPIGNYCNFEFSCIGVCVAAVGPSVASRTQISSSALCSIIRMPTSGYAPFPERPTGNQPWQLTVTIPATAFSVNSPLSELDNFRFNIFKCGDKVRTAPNISNLPLIADDSTLALFLSN